jgi:hypothetical protein
VSDHQHPPAEILVRRSAGSWGTNHQSELTGDIIAMIDRLWARWQDERQSVAAEFEGRTAAT